MWPRHQQDASEAGQEREPLAQAFPLLQAVGRQACCYQGRQIRDGDNVCHGQPAERPKAAPHRPHARKTSHEVTAVPARLEADQTPPRYDGEDGTQSKDRPEEGDFEWMGVSFGHADGQRHKRTQHRRTDAECGSVPVVSG
jgi:hypothetical protein